MSYKYVGNTVYSAVFGFLTVNQSSNPVTESKATKEIMTKWKNDLNKMWYSKNIFSQRGAAESKWTCIVKKH